MTLEERIQRLEDLHEIQNLMGRHEYLLSALETEREFEELWAHAPDVTFEAEGLGVWEGRESIRRCYVDALDQLVAAHAAGMPVKTSDPAEGFMWEHTLTTPVIEVAEDGQTAKGMWTSPGAEALALGGLVARWNWVRYGIDFIKEGGRWKFWHFHIYRTFATPFNKSWVETALEPPNAEDASDDLPRPDRPNTYHDPYSLTRVPRRAPRPPDPYQTFGDTFSYARHNTSQDA